MDSDDWNQPDRDIEPRHTVAVVQSLYHIQLFVIPWTVACKVPLCMRFPRQEYWSGLPFPSPGDLPDSGIKPTSPALAGRFFTTEPPRIPEARLKEKKSP